MWAKLKKLFGYGQAAADVGGTAITVATTVPAVLKFINPVEKVVVSASEDGVFVQSRLRNVAKVMTMAVALTGSFEGLRTTAYHDPGNGTPTVCYGETRGVKLTDKYSPTECKAMLATGLVQFETQMDACIKDPAKIPDKSYVAFLDLTYNIGASAFCHSTVAKDINAGNIVAACKAVTAFDRAGGRVLPGLVARRAKEKALCLQGLT
jgi:lysozyme